MTDDAADEPDPLEFLKKFGIYDHGGVFHPHAENINVARTPEYVFTKEQWKAMEKNAAKPPDDEDGVA